MGASLAKHRTRLHRHRHNRLNDDNRHQNQHPSLPPTAPSALNHQSQVLSSTSINLTNHTITNSDSNNIFTHNYPIPNNPIPSSSSSLSNRPNATVLPPSNDFAAPAFYLPSASPPPSTSYNFHNHSIPRPDSFGTPSSGWVPNRSPFVGPPPPVSPPPPPYIDHNQAKKIKNDINVHKDSIRLVVDESNLDSHLVSFTFDALVDGSINISYFAKEEVNRTFMPLYPEIYKPRRIPFKKGLGQKFCQPSGTGIDLGFFELDHLSKPTPEEDVFPLVICAEACLPSVFAGVEPDESLPTMSPNAQISQAVLLKNNEHHFQVKVVRQILWVDGVRYELHEIYGLGNSNESDFDDRETDEECVICMTEPKDTAVLPCRHMCLCSECAKELRLQSNKCPICRQPIQELVEIKINKDHSGTLGEQNPFLNKNF